MKTRPRKHAAEPKVALILKSTVQDVGYSEVYVVFIICYKSGMDPKPSSYYIQVLSLRSPRKTYVLLHLGYVAMPEEIAVCCNVRVKR